MIWGLGLTGIVLLQFFLSALVGLCVLGKFRWSTVEITLETMLFAVLVGYGFLVLILCYLAHTHLTVSGDVHILLWPLSLLLLFFGYSAFGQKIRFSPAIMSVVPVILLVCFFGLLSIFLYQSFNPYNDTFTYISVADYAIHHSFMIHDTIPPYQIGVPRITLGWVTGDRMGEVLFLSFLTNLLHIQKSIVIFPAVSLFGFILTLSAVYLFLKQVLKVPVFFIVIGILIAVFTANPLYWGSQNGFFEELLGMAFLVAAFGMLSVYLDGMTVFNEKTACLLFAFFFAVLIVAYPSLSLVLLLVTIGSCVMAIFYRKKTIKQILIFLLCFAILTLAISNAEFFRNLQAQWSQMHAVLGWNIGLTKIQFVGTALGIQPGFMDYRNGSWMLKIGYWVLLLFFCFLFVTGVWKAFKNKQDSFYLALLLFIAMGVVFAYFVKNPFVPGQIGQTWDIFKVTNWSYPFFLMGVVLGLSVFRWSKQVSYLLLLIIVCFYSVAQVDVARNSASAAIQYTDSSDPFAAYGQLVELSEKLSQHFSAPVVEIKESDVWNRRMLSYYFYPLPFYSDFSDDPAYIAMQHDPAPTAPHLVLVDEGVNNSLVPHILPARMNLQSPVPTFNLLSGWYGKENDGSGDFWWSNGNAVLSVGCMGGDDGVLSFALESPVLPNSVRISVGAKQFSQDTFSTSAAQLVKVPFSGDQVIEMLSDKTVHYPTDPRVFGFRVRHWIVTCAPTRASS